jgi:hypothetical protein
MEETAVAVKETGMMVAAKDSIFLSLERFEFAKKVASMLAASSMVPEQYRGPVGVGNCMIALNLAERLGVDVFGLMQTSYVVHGRPGFEAKLVIALFNAQTKLFVPPLRWEFKGDFPRGKDAGCRAYAMDKESGELVYGEWIDWQMVEAEGWSKKQGSKWLTMPGQMYRYRSAAFFVNTYEPGLKMGIMTTDELEDSIIDMTPVPPRPVATGANEEGGGAVYDFKKAPSEDEKPLPPNGPGAEAQDEPPFDVVTPEVAPEDNGNGKPKGMTVTDFLSAVKAARPGRGDAAKVVFQKLYINNKDLIFALGEQDHKYIKDKWEASGLKWGDFLEACGETVNLGENQVQDTTSEDEGQDSGEGGKMQPEPSGETIAPKTEGNGRPAPKDQITWRKYVQDHKAFVVDHIADIETDLPVSEQSYQEFLADYRGAHPQFEDDDHVLVTKWRYGAEQAFWGDYLAWLKSQQPS